MRRCVLCFLKPINSKKPLSIHIICQNSHSHSVRPYTVMTDYYSYHESSLARCVFDRYPLLHGHGTPRRTGSTTSTAKDVQQALLTRMRSLALSLSLVAATSAVRPSSAVFCLAFEFVKRTTCYVLRTTPLEANYTPSSFSVLPLPARAGAKSRREPPLGKRSGRRCFTPRGITEMR
jgi:hypothetical protein